VMKLLRLAQQPGMDAVAIKLNMEPTYEELKVAKAWADAFERVTDMDRKVFDIAADMEAGRG